MTHNPEDLPHRYSWHNKIQEVYQGIIERVESLWPDGKWLNIPFDKASLQDAANGGVPDVTDESPDSIAAQYNVFMPSHSYKVEFTLDQLLDNDCLLPLITKDSYLAVVDIGCGGGAGSTAVINSILKRQKYGMNVLFAGVEVNEHAIQLYDWMMLNYERTLPSPVQIDSRAIFKGIPEALTYIAEGLDQARRKWKIPYLSDLWVIQSNIVRPLANQHEKDIEKRNILELSGERGLIPDDFGIVIARAYEQLLQLTEADRMLMITVATFDKRKRDGTARIQGQRNRAEALTTAIQNTFSEKRYAVQYVMPIQTADIPLIVHHENPVGSYWHNRKETNIAKFYACAQHVESHDFLNDSDWQRIISLDNLKLAWVRVWAAMMRDSLADEIALIIFRYDVEARLKELRTQLLTYTTRLSDYPRFFYELPKTMKEARPKGLQSIEEEILAVATIQILGAKTGNLMVRNFAFRLNLGSNSEFLYRQWFRSYRKYSDTIRKNIKGQDEGTAVFRTDIQKFFNHVPQEALLQSALSNFQAARNPRISWLLRQLLVRSIENHEFGSGIMQGPAISGFVANLYLLPLDQNFSDERDDNSLFFRYVDDIVVIVPDPANAPKIKADLQFQLQELGLESSPEKTDDLPQQSALKEFSRVTELDHLDKEFKILTGGLYFADRLHQANLRKMDNPAWWHWIYQYQKCLREIGIFIEATRLSRKVWQYVNGAIAPINRRNMPEFELISTESSWADQYRTMNPDWLSGYVLLREKLSVSLKQTWNEWQSSQQNAGEKKRLQTRISFVLNRLAILGFHDVLPELVEMFCDHPHVIKGHKLILDHCALQQHIEPLRAIWKCIDTFSFPGSSYIRAMWMHALRYLNEIPHNEITLLANYSLQESETNKIERLIATETLLITGYKPKKTQGRSFFYRGRDLQSSEPRAARNLALLAATSRYSFDHTQLREIFDYGYAFSQPDNLERYREEPELEEIRKTYYHSRYPDGPDEFEGDYF